MSDSFRTTGKLPEGLGGRSVEGDTGAARFCRHRLRELAWAVAFAVGVGQSSAHALGINEALVQSGLGDRLEAIIPLTTGPGETLRSSCFSLAGSDGARMPTFVDAQLSLTTWRGGPALQVTTRRPVREPINVFSLSVRCTGLPSMTREFTVMLDPPRMQPDSPGLLAGPAPAAVTTSPANLPRRPAAGATASQPAALPSIAAGSNYRVQAGDTLSTIASRVAGRPSGSVWRIAGSILAANPQAFLDHDGHLITAGSVIFVPDLETALRAQPLNGRGSTGGSATRPVQANDVTAAGTPATHSDLSARAVAARVETALAGAKRARSVDALPVDRKPAAAGNRSGQLMPAQEAGAGRVKTFALESQFTTESVRRLYARRAGIMRYVDEARQRIAGAGSPAGVPRAPRPGKPPAPAPLPVAAVSLALGQPPGTRVAGTGASPLTDIPARLDGGADESRSAVPWSLLAGLILGGLAGALGASRFAARRARVEMQESARMNVLSRRRRSERAAAAAARLKPSIIVDESPRTDEAPDRTTPVVVPAAAPGFLRDERSEPDSLDEMALLDTAPRTGVAQRSDSKETPQAAAGSHAERVGRGGPGSDEHRDEAIASGAPYQIDERLPTAILPKMVDDEVDNHNSSAPAQPVAKDLTPAHGPEATVQIQGPIDMLDLELPDTNSLPATADEAMSATVAASTDDAWPAQDTQHDVETEPKKPAESMHAGDEAPLTSDTLELEVDAALLELYVEQGGELLDNTTGDDHGTANEQEDLMPAQSGAYYHLEAPPETGSGRLSCEDPDESKIISFRTPQSNPAADTGEADGDDNASGPETLSSR